MGAWELLTAGRSGHRMIGSSGEVRQDRPTKVESTSPAREATGHTPTAETAYRSLHPMTRSSDGPIFEVTFERQEPTFTLVRRLPSDTQSSHAYSRSFVHGRHPGFWPVLHVSAEQGDGHVRKAEGGDQPRRRSYRSAADWPGRARVHCPEWEMRL